MTSQRLRFAIFGNVFQARKSAAVGRMLDCLAAYGDDVALDRAFHDFLTRNGVAQAGGARVFDGDGFDAVFEVVEFFSGDDVTGRPDSFCVCHYSIP